MTLQQTLTQHIVEKHLKGQAPADFDDDFNLIESGIMDSLTMISLVSFVENTYDIEFGDQDFVPEHFQSINAIAAFIQRKQAAA